MHSGQSTLRQFKIMLLGDKTEDTITKIQIKNATLYHADCWDLLSEIGEINVIITDPPYGIGANKKSMELRISKSGLLKNFPHSHFDGIEWDKKIDKKYIDLILSISKNQIFFGGNYYANWLPPSPCWIVWDKDNGTCDSADCELIYTSYKTAVRKIRYKWNGVFQEDMKNKETRYHPTQKPLWVMGWLLDKYTKKTELILDPFMGSGTTGVACIMGNRKFIGIEKEKRYFDIACKRISRASKQQALF